LEDEEMRGFFIADKRWKRFVFLFVSAILTAISVAYPKLGFLNWVSLVPLALVFLHICPDKKVKLRHVYWYAFFFLYVYYLPLFTWFLQLYPFPFISEMTKGYAILLAAVMWLGSTLLESLVFAFSFLLFAFFARGRAGQKYPVLNAMHWQGFGLSLSGYKHFGG